MPVAPIGWQVDRTAGGALGTGLRSPEHEYKCRAEHNSGGSQPGRDTDWFHGTSLSGHDPNTCYRKHIPLGLVFASLGKRGAMILTMP